MTSMLPTLLFLLLTTILGWIIGWLFRKLKDGKRLFNLTQKLDSLRETIARQRLELSATADKNNYMDSFVKDQAAPLANQAFDSEYDKLKVSEKDLKIKLSQLYAKKQAEIERLSKHIQGLEARLNTINSESTIDVYPEETANELALKLEAQLQESEAEKAAYLAKIKQFEKFPGLDSDSVFEAKLSEKTKRIKGIPSQTANKMPDEPSEKKIHKYDLTVINGIGPIIQGILYGEDIFTIQKIADLEPAEISLLEEKLGKFGDRIVRDKWVEQAKALLQASDEAVEPKTKKPSKVKTTKNKEKAKSAKKSDSVEDDLTQIKGVGPKLRDLLHAEGVTTFEQVASFKAADIRALAEKLGSFGNRIKRDNWVKQAKKLAK